MNNFSNMGKKWSNEEITQLLKQVYEKKSIKTIAETHKRTTNAIRCRLLEIAADYHYNENRSIKEIMKFTGLSENDIEQAIEKRGVKIFHQDKKIEEIIEENSDNSQVSMLDLMKKLENIERKLDLFFFKKSD